MGIRGLETFIDKIYISEDRKQVFEELKLAELKLVIDGNQFSYVLSSLYGQGHYGGNYDQFYQKVRRLLIGLKGSIEIVIFDGAKESIEKSKRRLQQKIARVSNINLDERIPHPEDPKPTREDHLKELKDFPSLFNRVIIYKLLNELGINYAMCEGMADHVIALYANGYNPKKEKFTVMTKASFFNIYNLDKGYLSTKYTFELFKNIDKLDPKTTVFPIFYLKKLLNYLCLEKHITWIYFCILCGNNDDEELKRNMTYLKEFNIDTRGGNLIQLIAHCKMEETKLLETNFRQIRCTYRVKREIALKKIDDLIDLFEMKNFQYKFLEPFNKEISLNDFDRLYATVKSLNCYYINCLVEDSHHEESVFQPAIGFIRMIYSVLWNKLHAKYAQVDEFIRVKSPTAEALLDCSSVTSELFNKSTKDNKYLNFLLSTNDKLKSLNLRDDLTLVFVSCSLWDNWIEKKLIKYEDFKFRQKDFVEALILNFVLITVKSKLGEYCTGKSEVRTNDLTQESLARELFKNLNQKEKSQLNEMNELYEKIVNDGPSHTEEYLEEYFSLDLKLVHRLNEFQAIYYSLGALSKLNDLKFDFLTPDRFLNSYFFVLCIKSCSLDVNNNVSMKINVKNDLRQLNEMVITCELTSRLFLILKEKFSYCKKILNKTGLNDLLSNLKLDK